MLHERTPDAEVAARIEGFQVVLANKAVLDRRAIAGNRQLRLIALTATGTDNVDLDAARSLGCDPAATLRRVHLPLLRGGLLTAALLVFVDVMKELPATLVMRPFDFDTLATQAYTLASDERLAEASTAALAIVAVGVLPLVVISRQIARGRPGTAAVPGDPP